MTIRRGVPSFSDQISADLQEQQLRQIAAIGVGDSLNGVFRAHRDGRLDEDSIDRFYKRRSVGWRVLLERQLAGRALVVGEHDESVALALAEVLDAVWVMDTTLTALETVAAVASSVGTTVHPVHTSLEEHPFPPESFDLVVVQCPASELSRYRSQLTDVLARDGRLAFVVDGWTRTLGLAAHLGMASSRQDGLRNRLESAFGSVPAAIEKGFERNGLAVEATYALLSRGRHENELAFDARSDDALTWLLEEFDAVADTDAFDTVGRIARLAHRSGLLAQCYPRYLFVCGRSPIEVVSCDEKTGEGNTADEKTSEEESGDYRQFDGILLAGKNRTTVLELRDGQLECIRKITNSRRHAVANENAERATATASTIDSIASTVPESKARTTAFGPERIESPVRGTPLDQLLDRRPERFERCLDVTFDWLERLQTGTRNGIVRADPSAVVEDLSDDRFGLPAPPTPDRSTEFPRVLTHGDYFGSNIYVDDSGDDWQISGIIDWEWASRDGNPIVDSGFVLLQIAATLWDDFERGFEQMFVDESPYSAITYDRLSAYCRTVGVDPRTVATYLPIGYIERSRNDVALNGRLDIDWPSRVRYVWDQYDALQNQFGLTCSTDQHRY